MGKGIQREIEGHYGVKRKKKNRKMAVFTNTQYKIPKKSPS
jgi:hypothetical protein